ncbi:MAG TPA: hypothetical protein VOA78_03525 [Candidatus Dormibacteraeota bacterium]|nr:hypothetical protein [Candidatus Dormibacteraeota bacterium]
MSNKLSSTCKVLSVYCLAALAAVAQAQTPKPLPPKRIVCSCAELRFILKPGASQTFILPAVQSPVRIDVSFTLLNGGTQEPSELMYAVVNQDPSSKQLTWIGTNNDGSTAGSSSLKGNLIASIFGGGPPTTNASLEVASAPARTLVIKQNAATTIIPGHYIVRFYF